MKVILLTDVQGSGKKDDIIQVSTGYARNYLFPKKWAVEAKPGAIKEIERKRAKQEKIEMEKKAEALEKADKLRNKIVELSVRCGTKGRLYGSVTTQEIANALLEQHSVEVDKRKIVVKDSIRQTGSYEMSVTLHTGITVAMHVNVEAEKA